MICFFLLVKEKFTQFLYGVKCIRTKELLILVKSQIVVIQI